VAETRFTRQYYLLVVLLYGGVNATAAIYTQYLLFKGFDTSDVYLIRLMYYVVLVLVEFPTGLLADWLGRRTLVMASCVLSMLSVLLYAFSDALGWFIVAEVLVALGQACANGACESWFVDQIDYHGGDNGAARLRSRFSKVWVIKHFASLFAGAAGGWIADASMMYPWLLASVAFGAGFCFSLLGMREDGFVRRKLSRQEAWTDLKHRARTSFKYGTTNSDMRFLMVTIFSLYVTLMAPNLMWQPFFAQWVPDKFSLGLIWAGSSAFLMLGSMLAPLLANGLANERKAMLICCGVIGVGMMGAASLSFPLALVVYFIYQGGRGAFSATKDPFMHHSIGRNGNKERRAAISSFESIAYHSGGAIGLLAWGTLGRNVPIETAWKISGIILLCCVLALVVRQLLRDRARARLPARAH